MPTATPQGRSIDHIVLAVPDLDRAAATYEQLGFTLTPRSAHPDHMGTSNRLAQFGNQSFIELLEVDRPETQDPHDFDATPPFFSFGAQNRIFLEGGPGISALVFAGADSRADNEAFAAAGLRTYAPFEFERRARQPDGSEKTVAFTLAFATSPTLPGLTFFVCQNRFPENFWKPDFQKHANGAQGIASITLAAERPEEHRDFLATVTGSSGEAVPGGLRFACGTQALEVLTPAALSDNASLGTLEFSRGPRFVGFTLKGNKAGMATSPADAACGAFIAWQA